MKIGRFFKTHFRIHYTWILALLLISWAVTTQLSTETHLLFRLALGGVTGALFFFVILLRELVLLAAAVFRGVTVKRITVFVFGGLLQLDQETTMPSHEVLLAVAGLLSNIVITGLLFLAHILWGREDEIDVLLKWLAFLYFMLSLFDIMPAVPLDGGWILHAVLWKALNNLRKATRIASWISWVVGVLVMAVGIWLLISTVEIFTGVLLAVAGLILQNAATHSRRQSAQSVRQNRQT
jgi:Zn-dependent protease